MFDTQEPQARGPMEPFRPTVGNHAVPPAGPPGGAGDVAAGLPGPGQFPDAGLNPEPSEVAGVMDHWAEDASAAPIQLKKKAAKKRKKGRHQGKPEKIDAGDEPEIIESTVYPLGSRGAYDVIQDYVEDCTRAMDLIKDYELGAIEQFMTHMAFSSSDEAKPDVLGTIFTKVFEKAVGAVLSGFGTIPGGLSLKDLLDVARAVHAEIGRAKAAKGAFSIASYINDLRSLALTTYKTAILNLTNKRTELDQLFNALGQADAAWQVGHTTVVGDQARFLFDLDKEKNALLKRVSAKSLISYEEDLVVAWINDRSAGGAGSTDRISDEIGNGQIEIRYDSTGQSDGSFKFDFETAHLYVSAKSGNAADMLTRIMNSGKKVYELGIPVLVGLKGPNISGGQGYSYWRIAKHSKPEDGDQVKGPSRNQKRWDALVEQKQLDKINKLSGG